MSDLTVLVAWAPEAGDGADRVGGCCDRRAAAPAALGADAGGDAIWVRSHYQTMRQGGSACAWTMVMW